MAMFLIMHEIVYDQDMSTVGDCRYRQAIPVSRQLDVDTNFGLRRSVLPQVQPEN